MKNMFGAHDNSAVRRVCMFFPPPPPPSPFSARRRLSFCTAATKRRQMNRRRRRRCVLGCILYKYKHAASHRRRTNEARVPICHWENMLFVWGAAAAAGSTETLVVRRRNTHDWNFLFRFAFYVIYGVLFGGHWHLGLSCFVCVCIYSSIVWSRSRR